MGSDTLISLALMIAAGTIGCIILVLIIYAIVARIMKVKEGRSGGPADR